MGMAGILATMAVPCVTSGGLAAVASEVQVGK